MASQTFTHVYAALISIINTKLPQTGELLLNRLILQFRRAFRRNDKGSCLGICKFIAHLANQGVAHELVVLQILTLLLDKPSDDSVELAITFMKECGQYLAETSPRGLHAVFETLRGVLHDGNLDKRTQYMIEVMFAIRKDNFKDHPRLQEGLDLVEEDDQITHLVSLDEEEDEEDEDEDEDEEDEEDEEDDDDDDESESELSESETASAIFCAMIIFGAFLRCSRRSSVNPPSPIDVKKLIANLVFLGRSFGKRPKK